MTPMTLTIAEAVTMFGALSKLDGYTRIISEAGRDTIVQVPYSFSGSTRFTLARNAGALAEIAKAYETSRRAIVGVHAAGAPDVPESAQAACQAEINELWASETSVALKAIDENDLRLDVNPIPITTLVALRAIIDAG